MTAPCAEDSECSASAVNSGKPNTTPSDTSPSGRSWARVGRGWRVAASSAAASRPATTARPTPTKVGSRPSTATRVAGSEPLKPSTPRKPRKTATAATLRRGRPAGNVLQPGLVRRGRVTLARWRYPRYCSRVRWSAGATRSWRRSPPARWAPCSAPARDGRDVALKLLTNPGQSARFDIESRLLGRLSHPRVVDVIDHGSDDAHDWLAMELIEGPDLRAVLAERGSPGLPPAEVLEIARPGGRGAGVRARRSRWCTAT